MEVRNLIPLQAMARRDGLRVPKQLSVQTAERLQLLGYAECEYRIDKRGRNRIARAVITQNGIAAVKLDP